MDKHSCCITKVSYNERWPHFHPCKLPGIVEREGKWYCRIHDPEKVKEREKKAHDRYRADVRRSVMGWHGEELLSACKVALAWMEVYSDAFLQAQISDFEVIIKQLLDAIKQAEG